MSFASSAVASGFAFIAVSPTTPTSSSPTAPAGWLSFVPAAVGFLQFLLLAGLTYYIFRSNAAQKIREREAAWYHKIVVDHIVERLETLFTGLQKRLLLASVEVDALRVNDVDKARSSSKRAIADAKDVIFQLRSEMGFRLACFDAKIEQAFTIQLELLENEIVKWFTGQPERHGYDASESLTSVLTKGQMELVRVLMRHEFSTWGFALPWSSKGLPSPR